MENTVNPLLEPEVYARAVRAAVEAFVTITSAKGERRFQLMKRAAAKSLRGSGCSREHVAMYAECIALNLLEREHHQQT